MAAVHEGVCNVKLWGEHLLTWYTSVPAAYTQRLRGSATGHNLFDDLQATLPSSIPVQTVVCVFSSYFAF